MGTGESIPQGRPKAKALGYQPDFVARRERPKAEALGYLDAKARATIWLQEWRLTFSGLICLAMFVRS